MGQFTLENHHISKGVLHINRVHAGFLPDGVGDSVTWGSRTRRIWLRTSPTYFAGIGYTYLKWNLIQLDTAHCTWTTDFYWCRLLSKPRAHAPPMISSSVGGLLSNCQPFHQLCKNQTTHRFSFGAKLLGVIKFHIFLWVMTKLLHLCFLQIVSNNKPNAPTMGTNSHISYNTLAQFAKCCILVQI
jgi:hypothetical protein